MTEQDYNGRWLKAPQFIRLEIRERVATIVLNRPERKNALVRPMMDELNAAFKECDAREDVAVLVIEGAEGNFCSGYDQTKTYGTRGDFDPAKTGALGYEYSYRTAIDTFDDDAWNTERMRETYELIVALQKPVIAKVSGYCLDGGSDLALSCDLVVAAHDAKIGFRGGRANGTPITHHWTYACGPQWAKRILFNGDLISGVDAAAIGLVLDAVPAAELDAQVAELARRISLVDSELLTTQKRIVNLSLEAMGKSMIQRVACENNARSHLSSGPARTQFKADMATHGMKEAVKNRDAAYGDGLAKARWAKNEL